MSEKVRIGFVGVGSMGQAAHLRNYVLLEDQCEIVALAEMRINVGKEVARRYGVKKVYETHTEMFEAESLDAVVASQPFGRHKFLLPDLFQAVPYVFSEKPIAIAPSTGRELVAAAENAGCVHMLGYHKRSDPATRAAKAKIDEWTASGEAGPMTYVRVTMPPGAQWQGGGFRGLIFGNDPWPELEAESNPADMSAELGEEYATFINYYIHQVNLLRHLLGESYRLLHANERMMVVRSESGVIGSLEMAPYETTIEWEETAKVCFEHGYVDLQLPQPLAINRPGRISWFLDDTERPVRVTPSLPWTHAMLQQAEDFLAVCRGERLPPTGGPEAIEDLVIAEQYIRALHHH